MPDVLVSHMPPDGDPDLPIRPLRSLFLATWPTLRARMARHGARGYAVAAVDRVTGEIKGDLFLPVDNVHAAPVIVGRDHLCDIHLDTDPLLSSRHLALIAHTTPDDLLGESSRLRVIDLQTGTGFADEHGEEHRVLTEDRAALITVGRHAVFAVRAERTLIATTHPDVAWAKVRARTTSPGVVVLPSPNLAPPAAVTDTVRALGTLTISSTNPAAQPEVIRVLATDADRGLLIGRNPRCHSFEANGLEHAGVSRVHLLVIRLGRRLFALDLATTNGTFRVPTDGGPPYRTRGVMLDRQAELILGEGFVTVRWERA